MLAFGAIFASATGAGIVSSSHTSQSLFLVVPVCIVMVATSLWILGSGIVFVRVRPNESVGGGPLLSSIPLLPGERVLGWDFGDYGSDLAPEFSFGLFGRQSGCVFVSDRRIIFVTYRFLRWPAASASVPFSELAAGDMRWTNDRLTVTGTTGVEHRFRFLSGRTVDIVNAAISAGAAGVDAPSVTPRAPSWTNRLLLSIGFTLGTGLVLLGGLSLLDIVRIPGIGFPPVVLVVWGVAVLIWYGRAAAENVAP